MATLIELDGTTQAFELPGAGSAPERLVPVQKAVGGYVELVNLPDGRVILCDEEGLLKRLPVNSRATVVTGVQLVGPVLICSMDEIRRWDGQGKDDAE